MELEDGGFCAVFIFFKRAIMLASLCCNKWTYVQNERSLKKHSHITHKQGQAVIAVILLLAKYNRPNICPEGQIPSISQEVMGHLALC